MKRIVGTLFGGFPALRRYKVAGCNRGYPPEADSAVDTFFNKPNQRFNSPGWFLGQVRQLRRLADE